MAQYPYFTEGTHDQGSVAVTSGNAARSTAVSSAEGRLVVDVADHIYLLEPSKHALVTLLTQVGKVYDGKAWKGIGMLKQEVGNPEFGWFK
jgi:hypothetical protein